MRGKMKRVIRMVMSLVMIATVLMGNIEFTCLTAQAAGVEEMEEAPEILESRVIEDGPMPYTMLAQCIISVSGDENAMYIDITTGAVGTASVIGIKDVKIMRKFWYGWKTVAVSSGGETNDHSMALICITYDNAVKGATYRITCVHYADVNGYTEGVNDTGEFVYTY